MSWAVFAIIGYVLGSIPFGLLLTQAAGLGDVRKVGSGSIGATNVLRMGNRKVAAATLLCDALKGLVPVLIAKYFGGPAEEIAAGFGAVAGHIFPVWLKFKGGKGVATCLGVLLAWNWILCLLAAATWIAVFFATRISSASALSAALVAAIASVLMAIPLLTWAVPILALVVWVAHRANIARMLKGEEPKSTFTKKA